MNFYVTGGSLPSDAPSYVERSADQELLDGLLEGEFCYVLTARQTGKSSLMVRTASRLRSAGLKVAVLDLTAIGGQNVSPDQWYHGLLDLLGHALDLEDELEVFWQANLHLGPLHRLMKALRQIVLGWLDVEGAGEASAEGTAEPFAAAEPATAVRLVIFVDEIDFVRSLPFPSDEFFAALRECYNRRSLDPAYRRVTFCLLGVASPADLIRDTRTTPFNIGRRIELNDFTESEAAPLLKGFELDRSAGVSHRAVDLLNRVLSWTEGHPYLTQKLCRMTAETLQGKRALGEPLPVESGKLVDAVCENLFFTHRAQARDDNLIFVRERLLRSEADRADLLELYLRIWRGRRVADDELDSRVSLLRLSGVVRTSQARLLIRNRIYGSVFNDDWVRSNLSEANLRRQREACRSGMLWATGVSSLVLAAVVMAGVLSGRAVKRSHAAQRVALALAEGAEKKSLRDEAITSLCFAGDGRLLVAGSDLGIALWDAATGAELAFLPAQFTRAALLDPAKGDLFASTALGFYRWPNLNWTGEKSSPAIRLGEAECFALPAGLGHASFSAAKRAGAVVHDRRVHVISLDNAASASVLEAPHPLSSVALNATAEWLAGWHEGEKRLQLWELENLAGSSKPAREFVGVDRYAFSPDGHWLLTAADQQLALCQPGSWRRVQLALPGWRTGRAIGPIALAARPKSDQTLLAIVEGPALISLYTLTLGLDGTVTALATLESPDRRAVTTLCLSADGSRLAALATDQSLQIWDLAQLQQGWASLKLSAPFPVSPFTQESGE